MRQGILNSHFFSTLFKNKYRIHCNAIEPKLNLADVKLQAGKKTTSWVDSRIYTDKEATGIIQPSPILEVGEGLLVCPALLATESNTHMVQLSKFLDHPCTLRKETHLAIFPILTLEQLKLFRPINFTWVRIFLSNNYDDAFHYITNLLETPKSDGVS